MSTRPNILFLLSDEHSFRCLSYLNPEAEGEPVHTPTLDRMAAHGTVFRQAYCQVPLCTPSRLCMLAGRSPMGCGGWDNSMMMRPGVATLPGTLADSGYTTCLVGKMHLGGDRQLVGFQHRPYGDLTGRTGHQWERPFAWQQSMRERTAMAGITEIPESVLQEQVVARETVAFLREHQQSRPGQPWFLCASFSRPHFPLTAPRRHFTRYWPKGVTRPKVGRTGDTAHHPMTVGMAAGFRTQEVEDEEMLRARAAYFGAVDYLDEILGDLLAVLARDGLLENTIVVYTTDHGELAGEHGLWWKNSWHEAAVRVPWIIQTPAQRQGSAEPAMINTSVSLADLFPTLCDLAGVEMPGELDGVSLADAVLHGEEPARGPVFFDNPLPRWGAGTENRGVRDGRYKYVRFRNVEPDLFFDLENDPLEQVNLLAHQEDGDAPKTAARLRGLIDESWDFDQAEAQYEADRAQTEAHSLKVDDRWGNLYWMPDGRLVAADTPLYDPVVVTGSAENLFSDSNRRNQG